MAKAVSWSEYISNEELKKIRLQTYLSFHFTKLLYHPLKVLKSIINIIRGKQTLKTERVFIAFINRYLLRRSSAPLRAEYN